MKHTILRIPAVKSESGFPAPPSICALRKDLWTKPVSLGARAGGLALR